MSSSSTPELPHIPVALAAPARRALLAAGLTTLEKLSGKTVQEVGSLHGMGNTAIKKLQDAMAAQGLAFRT